MRLRWPLPTFTLTSSQLVVASSVYWALAFNGAFFATVMAGRRAGDASAWGFVLALACALVALNVLLAGPMAHRRTVKPVLALLTVAAAAGSWFIGAYGITLDPSMLRNVLHTGVAETRELLNARFLLHMALFAGVPALLLTRVWVLRRPWRRALVRPFAAGPSRLQRGRGIGVVLAGLLFVPLLKRFSATSCPWELAEFGGRAAHVPHWRLGLTDGGSGHCFPSGHAVAAFAFFGVYFLWRHHRPLAARAALFAVLGLGIAFGWAQWARGAHFVSHTLWSAWLCWVIASVSARAWPAVPSRRPTALAVASPLLAR